MSPSKVSHHHESTSKSAPWAVNVSEGFVVSTSEPSQNIFSTSEDTGDSFNEASYSIHIWSDRSVDSHPPRNLAMRDEDEGATRNRGNLVVRRDRKMILARRRNGVVGILTWRGEFERNSGGLYGWD